MGGDGGVIATQRKYLRGVTNLEDRKDDPKNIREHQKMRTKVCACSSQPLTEQLKACEMGNIYNAEAIITALIDKSLSPSFAHIEKTKDLKDLKLTANPIYRAESSADPSAPSKYICPVTRTEFNGYQPFVLIWSTGAVLAEKAIREIGIEGLQIDHGPFTEIDIVKLLPVEEEIPRQIALMRRRREMTRKVKKEDKKRKAGQAILSEKVVDEAHDVVIESVHESVAECKKRPKDEVVHSEKRSSVVASASASSSSSSSSSSSKSKKSSSSSDSLSTARKLSAVVTQNVQDQTAKSSIFGGLFHKDHEVDKNARDLMMCVSGIRGTL